MGLPNLLENKQKYNLLKLAMNIVSIQVFESHNAKVVLSLFSAYSFLDILDRRKIVLLAFSSIHRRKIVLNR